MGNNKDNGGNSNCGGYMQQSIKRSSGRNYGKCNGDWQWQQLQQWQQERQQQRQEDRLKAGGEGNKRRKQW